jgi:hypothetical protein
MSGYFAAVMSDAWRREAGGGAAGGGGGGGAPLSPADAGAALPAMLEFYIDTSEHDGPGGDGAHGEGAGDDAALVGGAAPAPAAGRARITPAAFEAAVRFLYGEAPRLAADTAPALFITASYFGERRPRPHPGCGSP